MQSHEVMQLLHVPFWKKTSADLTRAEKIKFFKSNSNPTISFQNPNPNL